ncbi:HTTM domain-containing protein [Polyangium mundeleinium]|uniref:HTTM domain-containing protein n=1 Tax=Polyangium mundeleinium TaxID=2995306 RepID=A0ABT5F6E3_9BACT|nr:HTTM domain-containing protein [Polyangium mundeleinium]MDC0749184.1 HTTM domain-containing protein [Polyangium mundeleinium]
MSSATGQPPIDASTASEALEEAPEEPSVEDTPAGAAEKPTGLGWLSWHLQGYWTIFRDVYLTIDRRTLGFARLMLGFLLVTDLIRRTPDWLHMYSDKGVLPTHLNLFRPQAWGAFTLFNAFSTAPELWALWAVLLVTFLCVFVGYKTRIAHALAAIFVASMNGRILLIENGGYVVFNLLVMWTAFLPMGDRFSVDALLDSMRRRKEANADELNDRTNVIDPRRLAPHVSLVAGVILLQIIAIYYFNVIHKTGAAWKNGTAVHYVLWVDRMVTPIVAAVRGLVPPALIIVGTKFVLMAEATIPICLASPLGRAWARRLAVALMCILHIGFGATFVLGPFAWAMCVFSTLLFTSDDWDLATRTMRRAHRARVVLFDASSGASLWLCRVLKRLDLYELLTFRAEEGLTRGITVEHPKDHARLERSAALADIVAALPLGPTIAWLLRVPGFSHLVDAIWKAVTARDVSRIFGLRVPRAPGAVIVTEPSPLRRKVGRFVVTLRELAVVAMLAGAVNQAMVELWVINRRVKVPHPEPLRVLAQKMRYLQGWFMFSPNPVMDDGTIVVDAKTVDGRSIDPFTGKPPEFDLTKAQSLRYNQIWSDYFNRMHLPANTAYRDAMRDFIYRYPERTGRPEDTIVSGDVYWVQDMNPPFGKTASYKLEKNKLFSFENPAARSQPRPGG